MPNCNVRFGSKPEKLNESKCFPLFTQQRTSPRYFGHVRFMPEADTVTALFDPLVGARDELHKRLY